VKRELPLYPEQRITKVLQTSRMCKGRLLHYFPSDHGVPLDISSPSSWCGWHNDHGSLTGLTVAMFNDKDGKEVRPPARPPPAPVLFCCQLTPVQGLCVRLAPQPIPRCLPCCSPFL
jgi:hypothetical protein